MENNKTFLRLSESEAKSYGKAMHKKWIHKLTISEWLSLAKYKGVLSFSSHKFINSALRKNKEERYKNNIANISSAIYGDIIARRNGFTKIPYNPDHYKPDKPSYISRNKCYYISLDDLHGTFEAFKAKTKNTDYLGEYGFDGKLITAKSSASETHKFFK